MHTLRGVHYVQVTRMQITWYCLCTIFGRSTQYDRLSQQQLGFLPVSITTARCAALRGERNGKTIGVFISLATQRNAQPQWKQAFDGAI